MLEIICNLHSFPTIFTYYIYYHSYIEGKVIYFNKSMFNFSFISESHFYSMMNSLMLIKIFCIDDAAKEISYNDDLDFVMKT